MVRKTRQISSQKGVLYSAGAMGAATLVSRVLGLVREQVFAILFGAGNATDAFNIAFRIPNLFRDLFAEGAMSAALVPTFTQLRQKEGAMRGWRLAGLVFRTLFVIVSLISLLGIVFAPQVVELYASAFHEVPGKFELTVQMTRIMLPYFPLVVLAAAFMAILNACGVFFLPALASALFNAASILVGVLGTIFLPRYGIEPIVGMAVGVIAGGLVQSLSQLPRLYREGYRWQKRADQYPVWHQDPALKRMLTLMVPGTMGLAATQINILVNSIFATSQGAGAVSWLNYAFRLMQFPIGIFGVSLAAATLPLVSKLWGEKDVEGVSAALSTSLKQVFAINLPAAAGLGFLGVPVIRLIFGYGRFGAGDVEATASALAAYTIGLAAYSGVKVFVPAFYALGRVWVPVVSSALSVALNLIFCILLVEPLGFRGLGLAVSLTAGINLFFLLLSMRREIGRAGGRFPLMPILMSGLKNLIVALLMGSLCYLTWQYWEGFWPDSGNIPQRLFRVGVLIVEGVAITGLLLRLFRIQEGLDVMDFFTQKLKRVLRL